MMNVLSLKHTLRPSAPGAVKDGERPPLLILLHGVGANEGQMAQIAPMFDSRFVVLSVRSPITLGANAFAWFHVTFTPQGSVIEADEAEAGWKLLARFIDEAVEACDADPARVFVAGFSQGGIMALATLLTAPSKLAGVVSMSGRLLPEVLPYAAEAAALQDKRILIVHGEQDEKLGIHLARWARKQLGLFPLDLSYQELQMGHTMTQESLDVVTTWLSASLNAMDR